MDIANLKKLSAFLRTIPAENFDHAHWEETFDPSGDEAPLLIKGENVCGTTACVAGWAVIVGELAPYYIEDNKIIFDDAQDFEYTAARWLGLDSKQRAILFYPFDIFDNYDYYDYHYGYNHSESLSGVSGLYFRYDITNKEAADFIDLMIEHEDVDILWWVEVKKERLGELSL